MLSPCRRIGTLLRCRWSFVASTSYSAPSLQCSHYSSRPSASSSPPTNSSNTRRSNRSVDDLFQPRQIDPIRAGSPNTIVEPADKSQMGAALDEFFRRPLVRQLSKEEGLHHRLFTDSYRSFRAFCLSSVVLDDDLAVVFHDICKHGHDVDRLFPFFLQHAKKVFPHLDAMEELKVVSDLSQPHNWYPEARVIHRKIVFHSGPTNSGKTYHALKRFKEAKSGIYCGPLKLLAAEVFLKCKAEGLNCDMVTGEERRYAISATQPSAHVACTVEMVSATNRVEVAVIDEIQMVRDEERGWAWTRALLCVAADEVHVCGEPAAIEIVRKLLDPIAEHIEIREYERKTPLTVASSGLGSLDRIEPGDAIVCFNKRSIFRVAKTLEQLGIRAAVIYGDLPPGTKLAQAEKFNNPDDPTNVLVATDAIGMGLNLNIRRVVFASLHCQRKLLPNYRALQIAGRAGRFGTSYADGVALTLRNEDAGAFRDLMEQPVPTIERAGLAPTFDQIESFSFHLPHATFVNILDIFSSICSITDHFFLCTVEQIRERAVLLQHIDLPLKVRYVFCVSPLNVTATTGQTALVKMAKRFSTGQCLTFDWFMDMLQWPFDPPNTLAELAELEDKYDQVEEYLWLALRFPDMLPAEEEVRDVSRHIDALIEDGLERICSLIDREAEKTDAKEMSLAAKNYARRKTLREKAEFEMEAMKKGQSEAPSGKEEY